MSSVTGTAGGLRRATIAEINTVKINPTVRPELVVSGARGTHDVSNFLLIRIVTSDGVEGIGEVSATLTWSGEDSFTAERVIDAALRPALIGAPLVPVVALEERMDRVLAGNPFTKAGIATALWDAYARGLGVPLAVALGGPLRDEIRVKCSLSGNGDRLETGYRRARDAGFEAFKIKIGMDLDGDVDRLRQARDLAGPDAFIGLDANGGYDRDTARRAVQRMAEYDPAFLEQPVQPTDLAGMAAMRSLGLPIIADESVFGTADLMAVIAAGAADVISLYIGKSGGPGRALQMATLAAAAGIGVIIGSNGELGVGAAAQTQVAVAAPGLRTDIPSDIIGAHYYQQDVLDQREVFGGGLDLTGLRARIGDAPGLGVALRADLAAALGSRA
ncbi:mandelate racemase/muconate lactonizing enzyme family protein [Microlunatus soli]|uniref:Muconate cycloisomerase n=1 Tax=Microlunatus soli TaxID=630515 RepID=A0A1H1Z1E3_9ACTN|nr:enolase C-terminal domain-like protein [Microlunatus soli]SDT27407.1 muconate cycloisomerase [Microlunatus soli]